MAPFDYITEKNQAGITLLEDLPMDLEISINRTLDLPAVGLLKSHANRQM